MRNWFVLFTTTFTITTLVLAVAISLLHLEAFDIRYVLMLAIISALISLFMFMDLPSRLQIQSLFLTVLLDIAFIFTIVFVTSVIIGIHSIHLINFIITLSLVIIIYIMITLIYLFILTKEAEDMNKKIIEWRNKHVER